MAPPEASMAVVVIRVRVGKLVVVAMQTGPGDRPLLAQLGTATGYLPTSSKAGPCPDRITITLTVVYSRL